ncbi:hypothetical protein HPP92_018086 [Vanilla planifolia]|uniref:Protein FATTY ACID EXPORT 3, chloroplastic n=1 Tax=Vanilla planifolia TaxID=51239 RepID=A0A835Q544_VANPL|nr:hypothetical protein HPP92_018086 [Vanilla planifolia]
MAAAVLTFVSPVKTSTLSSYKWAGRHSRQLPRGLWNLSPKNESSRPCFVSKRSYGLPPILLDRRMSRLTWLALPEETNRSEIEVEKENDLRIKADESQEAWKQTLETFKEEAAKMKDISQEAYEVYSKRAMDIWLETSDMLKIQAEKARQDLAIMANEISKEGQVYLSTAAKNSPEPVKDIVETFASSATELKEVSLVRDFYLGVPYGAFLAIGGFLNFMVTGSIPAIRFGIILGSALLALSILSLRSWKSGKPVQKFVKGQAAIAMVILIREWRLFSKMRSLPTFLMTLISGSMVAFYVYRIMIDEDTEDKL